MWEYSFLRWIIETIQNPVFDVFFKVLTASGELAVIYFLIAIGMLFHEKTRKTAIIVMLGLIIIAGANNLIFKNIFQRIRPFNRPELGGDALWLNVYMYNTFAPHSGFNEFLVPDSYSFMSGHTLSSFIFAFVISYYHRKWAAPAIVLASLMAFSRLYFGFHYPTDIAMGVVTAAPATVLLVFLDKKYGDKVALWWKTRFAKQKPENTL